MAAGIEALLRSEERFDVERITTGEELDASDAEVVVADMRFVIEHGGPATVPTIVLVDPVLDRRRAERRAPAAKTWLPGTAKGAELVAAIDASALPAVEVPIVQPAKPAKAKPIASTERLAPVDAPRDPESVALVAFGMAAAGIALSFLWLAVRP